MYTFIDNPKHGGLIAMFLLCRGLNREIHLQEVTAELYLSRSKQIAIIYVN